MDVVALANVIARMPFAGSEFAHAAIDCRVFHKIRKRAAPHSDYIFEKNGTEALDDVCETMFTIRFFCE